MLQTVFTDSGFQNWKKAIEKCNANTGSYFTGNLYKNGQHRENIQLLAS